MKEGGRGNSSRMVNIITRVLVVGQIALTAALLIAATLEIKSIRNQMKLDYGYDENAIYAARMALMEGAYPSEDSRREFFKRAVRASAGQSAVRVRRDEQSFSNDIRRPAANTKLTVKIISPIGIARAEISNRSRTIISRRLV